MNENPEVVESQAVTVVEQNAQAMVPIEQLGMYLTEETKRRELLDRFIRNSLQPDIDYGQVPGCGKKDFLFKAGAERIASLLHLTAEFEIDKDTYKMLGNIKGTCCYVCYLSYQGIRVGEGRGVVENGEKKWKANMRVKIAQKRAYVDATLRTSGLSGRFTQDEDSVKPRRQQPQQRQNPPRQAPAPSQPPQGEQTAPQQEQQPPAQQPAQQGGNSDYDKPGNKDFVRVGDGQNWGSCTDGQIKRLFAVMKQAGIEESALKQEFGIESFNDIDKSCYGNWKIRTRKRLRNTACASR